MLKLLLKKFTFSKSEDGLQELRQTRICRTARRELGGTEKTTDKQQKGGLEDLRLDRNFQDLCTIFGFLDDLGLHVGMSHEQKFECRHLFEHGFQAVLGHCDVSIARASDPVHLRGRRGGGLVVRLVVGG